MKICHLKVHSGNESIKDEEEDSVGEVTELQADLDSGGGAELAREEGIGGEEEEAGSNEEPDDDRGSVYNYNYIIM